MPLGIFSIERGSTGAHHGECGESAALYHNVSFFIVVATDGTTRDRFACASVA